MDRIDELVEATQSISNIINAKKTAKHRLEDIQAVLQGDILDRFDESVFRRLINYMTVRNGREVDFTFNCGITTTEYI